MIYVNILCMIAMAMLYRHYIKKETKDTEDRFILAGCVLSFITNTLAVVLSIITLLN